MYEFRVFDVYYKKYPDNQDDFILKTDGKLYEISGDYVCVEECDPKRYQVERFIVEEDGCRIFENDVIEESSHGRVIRRFVAENIRTFTRQYDESEHSAVWKVITTTHGG